MDGPAPAAGYWGVTIRAILFDSGGTLTRTIGHHVDPRSAFQRVLLRHWPQAPLEDLPAAFRSAAGILDRAPGPEGRTAYHRSVLAELGMRNPPRALLDDLQQPADSRTEPFPEVPAALGRLRERGFAMAVVTDSLETADAVRREFHRIGLAGYFDAFAVAGEVGHSKPDPRIYRAASDALRVEPAQSYYVDDHPALVAAATDLGYHGVVLCRGDAPHPPLLPWVSTLDGLADLP